MEKSPELKIWHDHAKLLLDRSNSQLDNAPFLDLDSSPENRAEKYSGLFQSIPWGLVKGEQSYCDVPRLIRAFISVPPELSARIILDTQNKDWRFTEMSMEALTNRPNEREETENQLMEKINWQRGQLIEKIAAIIACVLCYQKGLTEAKELLEDIGDSVLKFKIIEDLQRNHMEVWELIK